MFFAFTSLGISWFPVGPYIPIMNEHKRIIPRTRWVEPYFPFQEAEENIIRYPRPTRPHPIFPGPIYIQKAEKNGPFRPFPIHPLPSFQEDENGFLKKLKRHLGAGGFIYGIPFQEAEENKIRYPRPTGPHPILPGPFRPFKIDPWIFINPYKSK